MTNERHVVNERDVVLLLDLADENQLTESWLRPYLPSDAPAALRLTAFGAERCKLGTPDRWLPVVDAIERMLRSAREGERDAPCRYWIAGKAGLPAFFYLGYRLSRMARVNLIHPREDGTGIVDQLRLDLPDAGAEDAPRYFERMPSANRRSESKLPVGLLVAARRKIAPEDIERQMAACKQPLSAVVAARAAEALSEANAAAALRELYALANEIHDDYPAREALALFIAGPSTLAFLTGRALSQSVFPDLRVFQYKHGQYELAFPIGYRRERHPILFLTSNPRSTERLELDEEQRAVDDELKRSEHRARFELVPKPAPRPGELITLLREHAPTVLHVSGHGEAQGVVLPTDGGRSQLVPGEDLAHALATTGSSVRIAVLNACYSDTQARALLAYADCVVAMHGKIYDPSAKAFAVGFYGALGAGDSVQEAFAQGCARLALERGRGGASRDLAAESGSSTPHPTYDDPQLYVRDGVDAKQIILAPVRQ